MPATTPTLGPRALGSPTCMWRHRASLVASLRPDAQQLPPPVADADEAPDLLIAGYGVKNLSASLSPHGTGERAGELSHAALIEFARRSPRGFARAASQHAQRAKRSEFWGETAKPPRIAPWGLLFTDPRRPLAREKWLPSVDSNHGQAD